MAVDFWAEKYLCVYLIAGLLRRRGVLRRVSGDSCAGLMRCDDDGGNGILGREGWVFEDEKTAR